MKNKKYRYIAALTTGVLCLYLMSGCGGNEPQAAAEVEATEEYVEYEDYDDYGEYEEYDEYDDYDDAGENDEYYEVEEEEYSDTEQEKAQADEGSEKTPPKKEDDKGAGSKGKDLSNPSNEDIVKLAVIHSGAPLGELDHVQDDGHLYIHLYEDMGDHTATVDWYEIDPKTLKGTNFLGDDVDLNEVYDATTENTEGSDEGEGVQIADGEYVTDDEYKGEISADGSTLTITTSLSEFVNSPPKYEKRTYVIPVSDKCKCVTYNETVKEEKVADRIDYISEFLEGKSGLPITLKFKNNELVEIAFSS